MQILPTEIGTGALAAPSKSEGLILENDLWVNKNLNMLPYGIQVKVDPGLVQWMQNKRNGRSYLIV